MINNNETNNKTPEHIKKLIDDNFNGIKNPICKKIAKTVNNSAINVIAEYRGKNIDDNSWVYGSYFQHKKLNLCIATQQEVEKNIQHLIVQDKIACDWNFENGIQGVEVYKHTVGQYTGIKDFNGVKIFAGDIVEVTCKYKGNVDFHNVGIVKYIESSFVICIDGDDEFDFPLYNCVSNDERQDSFVIIGNVYDNPGLLEAISWQQ